MTEHNKTPPGMHSQPKDQCSCDIDNIAERYLDLWQENLQRWATDPEALKKWLDNIKDQNIKP
ncbi:MAG: hypothetical protein K9G26_09245 [Emcibacter sp.]|nr:hypothetical protein [Emcibacter sp.]